MAKKYGCTARIWRYFTHLQDEGYRFWYYKIIIAAAAAAATAAAAAYSNMAMPKGFFDAPAKGAGSGGSSKKKAKAARAAEKKANTGVSDVFAVPGVSAKKAYQTNTKKYDLNYSRFDSIGAREAKRDERAEKLNQLPPALRERLGDQGAEMALEMAAKMEKNPELMPTQEELKKQLEEADILPGGNKSSKKKAVSYKTSGNAAAATAEADAGSVASGIDGARSQLEAQMKGMEEEQQRLMEQQEQLSSLAESGDGEAFAKFLLSQGLSETQVMNMMEKPGDPAGLELLKQTLDISMGVDSSNGPTKDGAMPDSLAQQLDAVEALSAKIEALGEEEAEGAGLEEDDGIEEFATDGAAQLEKSSRKRKNGRKKKAPARKAGCTAEERKMQEEIKAMQNTVEETRKAAEANAKTVAGAKAELAKAQAEYAAADAQAKSQGMAVDEAAASAVEEDAKTKKEEAAAAAASAAAYEVEMASRKKKFAATQALVRREGAFVPAAVFAGARAGHVFKSGSEGLGYYPCPLAPGTAAGAPEEEEEEEEPPPAGGHLTVPVSKLESIRPAGGGAEVLRWTVDLPLLSSIKEVELDLTNLAVRLCSSRYAELELELPLEVDPDGAKAKFMKKTKQLRVEMPVANVAG